MGRERDRLIGDIHRHGAGAEPGYLLHIREPDVVPGGNSGSIEVRGDRGDGRRGSIFQGFAAQLASYDLWLIFTSAVTISEFIMI